MVLTGNRTFSTQRTFKNSMLHWHQPQDWLSFLFFFFPFMWSVLSLHWPWQAYGREGGKTCFYDCPLSGVLN